MRGPRDHHRERELRSSATDAEQRLWYHLRDRRLDGRKFRRQVRIGPYIADFACADARLVVEVDGGQHADDAERDRLRTAAIEADGYRVIRFWNDDVLLRTEDVLAAILTALRGGGDATR